LVYRLFASQFIPHAHYGLDDERICRVGFEQNVQLLLLQTKHPQWIGRLLIANDQHLGSTAKFNMGIIALWIMSLQAFVAKQSPG
jgi:hypothetical protein